MSIYRYKHELKFKNYIHEFYNFHIDPVRESHLLFQKKLRDIVIGKSIISFQRNPTSAASSRKAKKSNLKIGHQGSNSVTLHLSSNLTFSSISSDLQPIEKKKNLNFLNKRSWRFSKIFPKNYLRYKGLKRKQAGIKYTLSSRILPVSSQKYIYVKKRQRSLKEIEKRSGRFTRLICKPTFRITRQMVDKTVLITSSRPSLGSALADKKSAKKEARGNRTLSINYQMIGHKLGEFLIELPKPKKEKKKKK